MSTSVWVSRIGLVVMGAALSLGACAHTADRKLDEKISQERQVNSTSDLSQETGEVIDSASNLSDEQRTALKSLGASLRTQLASMRVESNRLRAVLVDDIVAQPYNRSEVALIKERISDVELRRVALVFGAVDQASTILGRRPDSRILHNFAETSASVE